MTDAFERAVTFLIEKNEGGYSNDPDDAGQATKYGISKARFPHLDIATLTLEQAKNIYRREFWERFECDVLPWPIAMVLFDCIVNHHPARPVQWLQTALSVRADGILGKQTMKAAQTHPDPVAVAEEMTAARMEYVKPLRDYWKFGKGWHRRHVRTLVEAVRGESR